MKKFHFISSVMFSVLFMVMVSCNKNQSAESEISETEILPEDIVELREDQIKLANVTTGTIELRSLGGSFKVNGTIAAAPQNLATVCMPMGGFVKSTHLMPGNAISKGQTLAIIENQEFINLQQNYLEAKSKLEYAEAELNRQDELYKNEVSSKKSFQQISTDYKSLKVQLKALEQKLLLIGIHPETLREENISSSVALVAPISGYIKAVNVNIGKFVEPSDVLFEIVNSDHLFLELKLFEKNTNQVYTGQKIQFFINNETEAHDAVIYQTGKSIGEDRTYPVYASILSECKNVLPGMYVNAVIESADQEVTAIPSEAVVYFDDKNYIFVFSRNKEEEGKPFTEYRIIEIQKGITRDGYTEIILPEDFDYKTEKVVVKGAYNLLSAMKNAGEMAC